jgi:GDP-D-mannose 3',5'-epimerase
MDKILVTGAGGFIGGHLVTRLKELGYYVRGADIKYPEFKETDADEFLLLDLRNHENGLIATEGMDQVYHLAANMGGMGFISVYQSMILHDNTLIDFNTLEAARKNNVKRFYFTSSACIYPEYRQTDVNAVALKEDDAYPAQPQDTYGWEKLAMEILCESYAKEYPIETRISRFHNTFGPYGTWKGGKEKAPAAISRRVAEAKLTGKDYIEIWGDGEQTRTFCYVSDTVEAIYRLMNSDYGKPVNIGQTHMVTINELAKLTMKIAGVDLDIRHIDGPQGVRGRNSDNTLVEKLLDWKPVVTLEEGMTATYNWVEKMLEEDLKGN